MKKCPKCEKIYDDSWKICLNCSNTMLVDAGEEPISTKKGEEPKKKVIKRKDVELTIGQYFLNRLGILSLVAGFAFFIAYSFQHIGSLGKLAVGFGVSALLLILGKLLEKKPGFQWYGFSLIAGGWSLGYFTTFAMHHIQSVCIIQNPHLALLALVLVTSLLMADLMRYKSQVVTTLIYLLAFFTAGIAKVTPFSLVYAALLTFSLIFVVYKMKWNRLMLVAIFSAYATHIFWLGPEILMSGTSHLKVSLEMSKFLLSAGFLTLYGILFGVSPLLVSCENEEDKEIQSWTTLLNAFFYSFLMFAEVSRINPEWKYFIALALGLFGILASYISKYGVKKDHLVISNMTLAIAFITISFPLKYADRWVDIAWLSEIPVLILLGLYFNRFIYRAFAWGLGFVMAVSSIGFYSVTHAPRNLTLFNGYAIAERSLIVSVAIFMFCAAQIIYLYFKKRFPLRQGENGIGRAFFVVATMLFLFLTGYDVHVHFMSITWAMVAFLFLVVGFSLNDKWFRYTALGLVGIIVWRIVFYDVRDLPSIYKIFLFIGLGLALLLASFVYGKIALVQDQTKETLQ